MIITGSQNIVGDNNRVVINQGTNPEELVKILRSLLQEMQPSALTIPAGLNTAFERIVSGTSTEADVEAMRQFLASNGSDSELDRYNINAGQKIQIGDRIYQGAETETIRETIHAILQENQILSDKGTPPSHIWRYLHTLAGHSGTINALALSPDGKTLVSGSRDRTIKVWHLGSMQLLHQLPKGQSSVEALAISSDGQTLVSGSKGGTVKVWELSTGALRYNLLGIHAEKITGIAICSDQHSFITASEDRTIKIWNLQTGKAIQTLQAGKTSVTAIALSPDDQWLASGNEGGTLRLWNLATGELHFSPISAHKSAISAIVMCSRHLTLLTASQDKTIKLWDLQGAELLYTFDPGQTPVNAMAISQETGIFVSGSEGGTVKFWDLASKELLYALNGVHFSPIHALAISPDSQLCVTSSESGNLKLWRKKM